LRYTQQQQSDISDRSMTRFTFPITAIILVCDTLLAAPPVTFETPCDCQGNHAEHRWSVKTDSSLPPIDASLIQSVTPSDVYGWKGMDVQVTMQSERTGIENNWYALTGRIADLMVEPDGDLHIALHDATGSKMGIVSCEIPVGPQWCSLRTTVFSWTSTKFPFHTSSTKRLMFTGSLIITVVGKAFWDIGHAPKGSE